MSERHHVLLAMFLLAGPIALLLMVLVGGAIFQHFTTLSAELARVLEILFVLLVLLAVGGTLTLLFLASAGVWRVWRASTTSWRIEADKRYLVFHDANGRLVVVEKQPTLEPEACLPLNQDAASGRNTTGLVLHAPHAAPHALLIPPLSTLLKPGYREEDALRMARAAREELARQALD